MVVAPSVAAMVASGVDRSAWTVSMPSAAAGIARRSTWRTRSPRPASSAAMAVPAGPAPSTTCTAVSFIVLLRIQQVWSVPGAEHHEGGQYEGDECDGPQRALDRVIGGGAKVHGRSPDD